MAKKSAKDVSVPSEVSVKECLKGPVVRDGVVHLSPYDLVRVELAQLRRVNRQQALELTRARQRELTATYEANLATLRAEEGRCALQVNNADAGLDTLRKELAELYSLDFSQVTYNPATGQLMIHEAPVLVGDKKE